MNLNGLMKDFDALLVPVTYLSYWGELENKDIHNIEFIHVLKVQWLIYLIFIQMWVGWVEMCMVPFQRPS